MALLQQPSLEKAAASIGISVSTAYRMRCQPEFQAEYRQARREAVGQAIARLQQGCNAASSTLLKIMLDTNSPTGSRVRAADRVIEHARKLMEVEDVEVRLQRLEQQIAALGGASSDSKGPPPAEEPRATIELAVAEADSKPTRRRARGIIQNGQRR